MQIGTSYFCKHCGEEIDCGIANWSNHIDVCKRNSPNENIEDYRRFGKIKQIRPNEQYILIGGSEMLKVWEYIFDLNKVKLVETPIFNIPKIPILKPLKYISGKEKRRNRRKNK